MIEIDVVEYNGVLYAAHSAPLPRIGGQVFRGPRLANAWVLASHAGAIKLDLKQSSRGFIDRLVAFLNDRPGPEVIITSRDEAALAYLADVAPEAYRLLSVASPDDLRVLRNDPSLLSVIDGVTIRHQVLDEQTVEWLHDLDLTILAWTVNDLDRVNELVELGVDDITTDNLAILELLGSGERANDLLERAASRRAAGN